MTLRYNVCACFQICLQVLVRNHPLAVRIEIGYVFGYNFRWDLWLEIWFNNPFDDSEGSVSSCLWIGYDSRRDANRADRFYWELWPSWYLLCRNLPISIDWGHYADNHDGWCLERRIFWRNLHSWNHGLMERELYNDQREFLFGDWLKVDNRIPQKSGLRKSKPGIVLTKHNQPVEGTSIDQTLKRVGNDTLVVWPTPGMAVGNDRGKGTGLGGTKTTAYKPFYGRKDAENTNQVAKKARSNLALTSFEADDGQEDVLPLKALLSVEAVRQPC
ncbi:hypothetical protein V6N13_125766 [Hibiscus sabdariffa]|uniref:Uncharacterized protein n=1 Tax=Hibiscus sabdariffa TaxID=183260 RepID=A0ABR2U6W7_9ROSI